MNRSNRTHHWRGDHGGHVMLALLLMVGPICFIGSYLVLSLERGTQATISVSTELVVLPVSVTDSQGNFVSGLAKDKFHVYEDGRLQTITLFTEEDTPVTVGLIVDHSSSMRPKLAGVATAVSMFAQSSNPEDEMFVVDFADSVSVELIGGKAFTSDPKELEHGVSAVSARGQTALYDAIIEGLNHLQLGHRDKKALVIVSDGGDNASHHKFAEVLDLAQRSHALIYAIGLVEDSFEEVNPKILEKLCKETGGIAFFPRRDESVSEISKKIARDLREQYTLGYVPEDRKGGEAFRKIGVEVSASGRGKVHVRTRSGYIPATGKENPYQPRKGAR